jgi:hypothetical protein
MGVMGHKEYGYDRLYEAVVYTPHLVKRMLRDEPELLKCTNHAGETVMHWFVVENDLKIVELLHECGGDVEDYALVQACILGLVDMVYLLLRIGVVPVISSCRVNIGLGKLPRKTLIKLKQAFHRFGYNLTATQ